MNIARNDKENLPSINAHKSHVNGYKPPASSNADHAMGQKYRKSQVDLTRGSQLQHATNKVNAMPPIRVSNVKGAKGTESRGASRTSKMFGKAVKPIRGDSKVD